MKAVGRRIDFTSQETMGTTVAHLNQCLVSLEVKKNQLSKLIQSKQK